MERINHNRNRARLYTAAALLSVAGFAIVLYCVVKGNAGGFDDPIRYFFYGLRNAAVTPAVKAVTYIGNWQTIVIICIMLLAVKPLRFDYGVPVSAGAIFVTILNKLIKEIVGRPRPDDISHLAEAGGFSFPSGHSITSMLVFGMLIYLVRTNVKNKFTANILSAVLAVPMICIGLSRIYLGVHYPTDVLAGWLLGIAVMMTELEIIKRIGNRRKDSL